MKLSLPNEAISAATYLVDEETGVRVGLVLRFSASSVVVLAQPDDDTIAIHDEVPSSLAPHVNEECLGHLIGKSPVWSWELTNNQGYFDGVQLEFDGADPVQLLVVASELRVFDLVSRDRVIRAPGGLQVQTLALTGWRSGCLTIDAINILRDRTSLGLRDAKAAVEAVLHGKRVVVELTIEVNAAKLVDDLAACGLQVHLYQRS